MQYAWFPLTNAGIHWNIRGCSGMTSCNKSCLPHKVCFHFDIKDHMAINFLVSPGDVSLVLNCFEGDLDVVYFLFYCIHPECVSILLVYLPGSFNCFGYFNPKLVGPHNIPLIYCQDDPALLLEDMWYLPSKCWHSAYAICLCIFCNLKGI